MRPYEFLALIVDSGSHRQRDKAKEYRGGQDTNGFSSKGIFKDLLGSHCWV